MELSRFVHLVNSIEVQGIKLWSLPKEVPTAQQLSVL